MPQKTVFIIGAGASKEVNLPVGSELKKTIAKILTFTGENIYGYPLNGDLTIIKAISSISSGKNQAQSIFNACDVICKAMPMAPSIDNFLDVRSDDELIVFCGKLAIVRAILQAEASSSLSVDTHNNTINFEKIEETWFNRFFQNLTENCKLPDLEKRLKSIALIIFNYDRCIEHYLYNAFQNYYPINSEDTSSLLKNLEIYHPYGAIGLLPWQDSSTKAVEYGANPSAEQIIELAQQIKTFTEGTEKSPNEIKHIHFLMEKSNRHIFLGFAFHRLNMDLLLPRKVRIPDLHKKRDIYATCRGESVHDETQIKNELMNRLGGNTDSSKSLVKIHISDRTCSELLKDYKRGLSFV